MNQKQRKGLGMMLGGLGAIMLGILLAAVAGWAVCDSQIPEMTQVISCVLIAIVCLGGVVMMDIGHNKLTAA